MAAATTRATPEFRAALLAIKEIRRFLDMLTTIFYDRSLAATGFSAGAMASDLLKCAVALDGLRRLGIYAPEDFAGRVHAARITGEISSPLALSALIEGITAGMLGRASRYAVPGTEIDWQIVRRSMRRAAVAAIDESISEDAMAARRRNADVALMGVRRGGTLVAGASDGILVREADRADAADPAAALVAALEAVRQARARIRRARARITEGRRAPRPPRTRRRRAATPEAPGDAGGL